MGKEKTNVLIAITGLAAGGATNVAVSIAKHLAQRPDFSVWMAAGPAPHGRLDQTQKVIDQGIHVIRIPTLVNDVAPYRNVRTVCALHKLMCRHRFHIVHTHSSVAGVLGRIAAYHAGVPVIVHHVHGWGFSAETPLIRRKAYVAAERLCARCTSKIVAVSTSNVQTGLQNQIGTKEQYALIHCGIDLRRFQQPVDCQAVRTELGLSKNGPIVGMIGRLDTQKNPLDFIRAAARVAEQDAEVQFIIVGDGALRSDCERLIRKLSLESRVLLVGFREDVDRIYGVLAITALTSRWEGLPLVFFESMAAGKPIVAYDVDGAGDVIVDGETGYLVPSHTPEQLADRIAMLLRDTSQRMLMGVTAKHRSIEFGVDRMLSDIEQLYDDLLAKTSYQAFANHRRRRCTL